MLKRFTRGWLLSIMVIIAGCHYRPDYLEPEIDLDNYHLVEGFDLQVVVSEPFIAAPVAMDFDNQGRIWVVEMRGYMPNLSGTGEHLPSGSISILEDRDLDGVADHRKIFLDSLVLPRALSLVYGGVLYAEPPNLWFVEIKQDKPGKRTLVDSLFADGGNVEHQPNGLKMNIDNWIYNAKSNFRYQKRKDCWIKEPTSYRGQWGISQDDFGRLFYNTNSTQLQADLVLPNAMIGNKHFKPTQVHNQSLTENQRVYPLHASSVNRGYLPGVLDAEDKLLNVTSACSPLVYRGNQFPKDFYQDVFVCVPEANLIKRNILKYQDLEIKAVQAYDGHEFLAATDEGFRPVNLSIGPDGALYIVDMHRGIIQHKAYLSPYLKDQIKTKSLDTLVNKGRILRVSHQQKAMNSAAMIQATPTELVTCLSSPNGWVRDRAQQLLIDGNQRSMVPDLKQLAKNGGEPVTQVHALYTLKGLEGLTFELLAEVASGQHSMVVAHALLLMKPYANNQRIGSFQKLALGLMPGGNFEVDFYLTVALGDWLGYSKEQLFPILSTLYQRHSDNSKFQEAVVSSLAGLERDFLESPFAPSINSQLKQLLMKTIENKNINYVNPIYVNVSVNEDHRTRGLKLFQTICANCHGIDGTGLEGLAPSLQKSPYITGPVDKLALIVFYGLHGGDEYNSSMPGLGEDSSISDRDIAGIIRYLHSSFSIESKSISEARIRDLKARFGNSRDPFTRDELEHLGLD